MARVHDGSELFGPVAPYSPDVRVSDMNEDEKLEHKRRVMADKENIKKGYSRIKEKVKEIRQNFSHAVTVGKRSGSGKIVFEHYDNLASLWGGCAGIEPLPFGVDVNSFDANHLSEQYLDNTNNEDEQGSNNGDGIETEDEEDYMTKEILDGEGAKSTVLKRKSEIQVVRLIDNKRKHLEKNLSASQRDQLLLQEAKEDTKFRKDLAETMRQSTASFSLALEGVSQSMVQIGNGLCRSLENVAAAMRGSQPPPQNVYYQQTHGSIYGTNYPSSLPVGYVGHGTSNSLSHENDEPPRYHSL